MTRLCVGGVLGRGTAPILFAAPSRLIESQSPAARKAQAQEVLQQLLPHTGKAKRIGITGVPGVGKSTFIEAFGCYLVEQGHTRGGPDH